MADDDINLEENINNSAIAKAKRSELLKQYELNKKLILYVLENKKEKIIINFIRTSGVDINYCKDEYNPLFQIIMYCKVVVDSNTKYISFLASQGADFNITWENKRIPLFELLTLNSTAAIKALNIAKESGANMYQRDSKGNNLLMHAIESKVNINVIKYLYSLNFDLSEQDNEGNTVYMKAIMTYDNFINGKTLLFLIKSYIFNNDTIINFILMGKHKRPANNDAIKNIIKSHNFIINIKNNEGDNPLTMVIKKKFSYKIFDMLISIGGRLDTQDKNGSNLIMLSAEYNNFRIFLYLLRYLPDLSLKNNNGDTLLIIAARNNSIDVVKILLYVFRPINKSHKNIKRKDIHYFLNNPFMNDLRTNYELKKNTFYNSSSPDLSEVKKKTINKSYERRGNSTPAPKPKSTKVLTLKEISNKLSNLNEMSDNEVISTIENSINKRNLNSHQLTSYSHVKIDDQNNDGDTALMAAIKRKNQSIVQYLIAGGAKIDITNNKNETPLMLSILSYDKKIFNLILENQNSINFVNKNNETALMIAINNNLNYCVEKLLEKGADINIKDNDYHTPVMNAAINLSYMYSILKFENNTINLRDKDGKTALLLAIGNRNVVNSKILLQYGANLSIIDKKRNNALMIACKVGLIEIVNYILFLMNNNDNNNMSRAIHIDDQNENLNTALMKACKHGHEEIVKLLIDNNAKLELKNKDGNTALLIACQNNQQKIIKLLLKAGADINCYNNDFVNPIIEMCNSNEEDFPKSFNNLIFSSPQRVKLNYNNQSFIKKSIDKSFINMVEKGQHHYVSYFINSGYILDVSNNNRNFYKLLASLICAFKSGYYKVVESVLTQNQYSEVLLEFCQSDVLVYACKLVDKEGINLLLKFDFNINAKDELGNTPLIEASKNSTLFEYVKEFIKRGADINAVNNDGESAFLNSCKMMHNNIFKYLIDKNADIYCSDNKGNNALMYSSCSGATEKMKYLIKKRINIDSINNDGDSSLMQALNAGKLSSVKYLISHDANIDIMNRKQQNALIIACLKGFDKKLNVEYTPIIKSLVQKNANPNIPIDEYGNTILMYFVMKDVTNMVKCILDNAKELDINQKNHLGHNAFTYALKCNNEDIIRYLIAKDIDIYTEDDYGNDMVMYSICSFNVDIFFEFIKMVDKEKIRRKCNHNKETYLIMASKHNNEKAIDMLLKEGSDVNFQNSGGNTALHYASCQGNTESMEMLINNQADLEIENYFHETPLMVACRFKQNKAVKCLLNHNASTAFIDSHIHRNDISFKSKNKEQQDEYINKIIKKYEELSEPAPNNYLETKTLIERMKMFYNRPQHKDRYNNIEKLILEGLEDIVDIVVDVIS